MIGQVTDATFDKEVLKAEKPVVVHFWAEWCPPCRLEDPIIEVIARQYQDAIRLVGLNADENKKTIKGYVIKGIATIIVFKAGREEGRAVGVIPKETIAGMIDKHLVVSPT